MARGEVRRVTVELLVKATSQREAAAIATERMNNWFLDPRELDPGDAGWPIGALLHFTVKPETGHRAVAL